MKTASSTTNLIASLAIVGAVTAGFATGAAFGQTAHAQEPFKFQFAYDPAELTTAPGAEKLLVRLQGDVRAFCGGNRKMSLDERSRVNACIDATLKDSISKFGSATLAQAFAARADG